MNDNDLRNVSGDDYRRLMAEAYPAPKTDIRAAVMAQITAEAAQPRKKAKILTPAFRNRFVKYGSIAACFVLLVTLGFRVVPMMTKDAAMESKNTTATADMVYTAEAAPEAPQEVQPGKTSSETQAAGGTENGGPVLYKAMLTADGGTDAEAPADTITEEPVAAAAYSAALEDTAAIENYSDVIAEEAEEEIVEEAVAEEAPAAPADEVPMLMMAPPPSNAVVEEAPAEEVVVEECEACIEEAVVEEAAAEIAAPEYYRYGNAPDEAEAVRRTFEYELKLDLSSEAGEPAYTDWMEEHGYADVSHWSIAEFAADFGIARERFTELYDALTVLFAQMHPGYAVPTYDLDKMYGMDADITASIAVGNPGYVTDELYRQ